MVKVLIVDDERLERILIRKGFSWEENGFEIVGEAGSGEEALEIVKQNRPDLVLTDIRMPYMTGLELAEQIRKFDQTCRIVIITGHREFEYARQAVRLGVEDFLLKPVNIEEVRKLVLKIREEIIENRRLTEEEEWRQENLSKDYDIIKESFYHRLTEGRVAEEEAVRRLELYKESALLKDCVCMNIQVRDVDSDSKMGESAKQVQEYVRQASEPVICFIHYTFHVLVYYMGDTPAKELGEKFIEELKEKFGLEVSIGISDKREKFSGILESYQQTEKALSAVVVFGKEKCITYQNYLSIKNENEQDTEINWKDFMYAVENGMEDKTNAYVGEYVEKIREAGVVNLEYLRLMTMNMISKADITLSRYGKSCTELLGGEKFYMDIGGLSTLEEMRRFLMQAMVRIIEFHRGAGCKKNSRIIKSALDYIEKNFTDPELSLKTVAAAVFANESYLSRIFKKEMGDSMIEYITKKRIAQSIHLLNTTDLKAYEIAEQVGFRDSHYFSICFKKQVGVTVKEYKNQ